jgi:hypothetical protein
VDDGLALGGDGDVDDGRPGKSEVVMGLLRIVVAALNVSACAVQQHPLTATAVGSLKGRQIAPTSRRPTPFFVSKPGKNHFSPYGAAGGVAIAAAMSDAGAHVARENAIADPAPYMAQQLIDDLQRRFGLKLERQAVYVENDDPKQITSAHPAADMLLDVWIDGVSLEPLPHDPSKYRVRYTAYLRLIDAKFVHLIDGKKGVVIGDGTCSHIPEETPNAPTYDEFLADGARRLKHELDIAVQSCVEEFRMKVLTPSPKSQ